MIANALARRLGAPPPGWRAGVRGSVEVKLPYREGSWFVVPVRTGGFAAGVVARCTSRGGILICYFFGPRRDKPPTFEEVQALRPSAAIAVLKVGDLGLVDRTWPVLGTSPTWRREEWPSPAFVRSDPLSGKSWRVEYDDRDPNRVVREVPLAEPDARLGRDSLFGSGAAEIHLSQRLA
jgi:hypothetical protein